MVGEEYQPYQEQPYGTTLDKPKKKINFLLLIIIGLIIIIGFTIFANVYQPKNQIETPTNIVTNTTTKTDTPQETPSDEVAVMAKKLFEENQGKSDDDKYFAILDAAKTKTTSVADAILICSLNSNPSYKNYCLQEMAENQLKPDYCEVIADPKQRDDCYMLIILQGEDQYCSKLVMQESKDFCDKLLNS